jgi:fatty aldehyde-generating acyl-ACP reductase
MITVKIMTDRPQLTHPNHTLAAFRKIMPTINRLIERTGENFYLSPYSLIAAVSRSIGLDDTLPERATASPAANCRGSGNYRALFAYEASQPFLQRKQLIAEMHDMIAPIVLNETSDYVDLLMDTKYHPLAAHSSSTEAEQLKDALREEISLFEPIVSRLLHRRGTFAHIAHFGCLEDLYSEQGSLASLNKEAREKWFANSYPIVIELQVAGLCDKTISGWLIFLPNSSEQLLMNETLRKKKLLQAAILGQRLGAETIGLAGLAASFSRGGQFLAKRIKNVGFTTGHAYTIANITRVAYQIAAVVDLNLSEARVAVVGAAGSIGSGVTKLLASKGIINNYILIDRDDMIAARRLELLAESMKDTNGNFRITTSSDLALLKNADLVILATCAPEGIIQSEHIKPGAIYIDDSYPKNVHKTMLAERDDFILLEGGVTQLPLSVDMTLSRPIPNLIDAPMDAMIGAKQTYGCFAETLVLAANGHRCHFGLGDASPLLAADIEERAHRLNFTAAPLQAFGQKVDATRIEKVKGIIRKR